jgi:hypothetical protein
MRSGYRYWGIRVARARGAWRVAPTCVTCTVHVPTCTCAWLWAVGFVVYGSGYWWRRGAAPCTATPAANATVAATSRRDRSRTTCDISDMADRGSSACIRIRTTPPTTTPLSFAFCTLLISQKQQLSSFVILQPIEARAARMAYMAYNFQSLTLRSLQQ